MLRMIVLATGLSAVGGSAAPADDGRAGKSFYEHSVSVGFHRLENGALRRGAFRSEPKVMDAVTWIVGEWDQTNIVLPVNSIPAKTTAAGAVQFSIDREDMTIEMKAIREGSRSHRLALFDPYARLWVRVIDGSGGFGVLTARAWAGDRLDLIGRATFLGRSFTMRHSLVRTGPDSFEIQNSELAGGRWRMFDKHVYQRRTSAG